MRTGPSLLPFAVTFLVAASAGAKDKAPNPAAEATRKDIRDTLGLVPEFLRAFPENAIAGAWAEMKGVQMNPNTAIPPKYKDLIGLGVAAQIPCQYCIYFHTQAAKAEGATEDQIKAALAEAALTRHWSTYLNGQTLDEAAFRSDVNKSLDHARQQLKQPPPSEPPMMVRTADDARREMTDAWGFVPGFMNGFPDEGLPGAWMEMRDVEMTPGPVPGKYLSLVGLGVSAQIPCHYCVYFDTQSAMKLENASDRELKEAITVAAIVRHWSTYLNGVQLDEKRFRKDTDQVLANMKRKMSKAASN